MDIVHENVAKPFTYAVPEGMELIPGQRITVPFGSREKEAVVLSLEQETDIDPSKIRMVTGTLENYAAIPPELMALAEEMAAEACCPLAETLRLMLPAQMRGGRVHVRTERYYQLSVPTEKALERAAAERRSGKIKRILEILSDGEAHSVKNISETVNDPREALAKLAAEKLVTVMDEEQLRTPASAYTEVQDPGFILSRNQKEALDEIIPTLKGKGEMFLLHGVTGSGKTEVFMKAVQETLSLGKGAIILVPEISLTPQMVSWFRGRFGSAAAVIHSRLSAGERYDEWRRIRRGDARVVIGARSAVFSPVLHLGLIVIDEEHETTYFNDRHPRYDTREVAASRCRRENASLILASATPSIQSFARAQQGGYVLLEMPERVNHRPLPEVEIVDMRAELEDGNRSVFSGILKKALTECFSQGEQAILLMNRRGYRSFVSCRSCGYVVKCPNCDISMTYHMDSGDGLLRCHYCGETMETPKACPSCGGKYIRFFGAGTQKVEEEVQRLIPGITTARMDYDTTSGKDGHGKILETFRSGKARVLIGTQMIAKGLDFPNVTLVGVVAADMALNLPDYRSRERAFQLFTQVAGRAGRGLRPGRVIIQTYKPEDPVIGFAAAQDYRSFYENELRRRRISMYPPYTKLVRILTESESEETAAAAACEIGEELEELLRQNPDWNGNVLMKSEEIPSVRFLRGKHRRQLLMKVKAVKDNTAFFAAVTALTEKERKGAEIHLEINPTSMI